MFSITARTWSSSARTPRPRKVPAESRRAFTRLSNQLKEIASALEEKANIPMVQQQIVLIEEIQTDDFWQGVTAPILENVRKKLRSLVKLIDKAGRVVIY